MMRVYCVYFVIRIEDRWLAKQPPFETLRTVTRYFLKASLFVASDRDLAYEKALGMIDGLSDADHDGPGDRMDMSCVGIHDMEDIAALVDLQSELSSTYGLDVGVAWPLGEMPPIKSRDELELFRTLPGIGR